MLVVQNVTKKFSGVAALEDVSLELFGGKVNAIIGENGAGKSTLMKILSGVYQDFEGSIIFEGVSVRFSNPGEAQDNGIAIIHQELNLIPYLSISENIYLGREILTAWGTLDTHEMREGAKELLKRLKLDVDPDLPVSRLRVGQQQVVEIAKALLINSKVIIMDEPTSAISENEVEVLFGVIDDLKKEGKTIVYISHKLDELLKIADKYVVLRDGRTVDAGEMKGMCQDDIIRKMAGRDIRVVTRHKYPDTNKTLLSASEISLKHPSRPEAYVLKDVSFNLAKGEILGIFGLMGAGRTELLETLFGLHPKDSQGQVSIEGKEVHLKSPADAIKAGLALVPEDRKKDGLVQGMDIRSNISLTVLKEMERYGLLDNSKEMTLAAKYIDELMIKTTSDAQAARNLSGGNQQKVVLAKWLVTHPRILMLDEPTRGIDVNAKNEIYKLIIQLAETGIGLIVASSEIAEILTVSDRILVMSEGVLTEEFPINEASEDKILKASIPGTI